MKIEIKIGLLRYTYVCVSKKMLRIVNNVNKHYLCIYHRFVMGLSEAIIAGMMNVPDREDDMAL